MSNYVIHTGVPGMSWGDRNGPPYPLSKQVRSAMKKEAAKAAKQGKSAAIQKTSQKVVNSAANKMTGKSKKLDIDGKKLVKEALFTMGTVAVTSLLAKGVDAGTDRLMKVGARAAEKAMDGIREQVLKRQFAKVGAIYI